MLHLCLYIRSLSKDVEKKRGAYGSSSRVVPFMAKDVEIKEMITKKRNWKKKVIIEKMKKGNSNSAKHRRLKKNNRKGELNKENSSIL